MKTTIRKWTEKEGIAHVGSVAVKCAAILAVRGKDREDSGYCLSLVCDAIKPGKMANTSLQEAAKRASCVMIGDLNKYTDTIFASRDAALRALEGFCLNFGVPCAPGEYDEIIELPSTDDENSEGNENKPSTPFGIDDTIKRMITITRRGGDNAPGLIAAAAAKLLEGPHFVAFAAAVSAEMEKRAMAAREQAAAVNAAAERMARAATATESKPRK